MYKNNKKDRYGVNPIAAAGAGAVIGAGVAVAASAALKNPKARKKIISTLESAKKQAVDKIPHAVNGKKVSSVKKKALKIEKKAGKIKRAIKAKQSPVVVN